MNVSFTPNLSGLYLMTDGISDPFFETDSGFEMPEKWQNLRADMAETVIFDSDEIKTQFKDWLGFWSPGNHDDRTIAFVV